jgi:sugar phosphate isomerase/epimerase
MPCINAVSFHEDPSIESICRKVLSAGFDAIEVSRPPFYYKLTNTGTRKTFAGWAANQGLRLFGFDCWVDVSPYTHAQETLDGFKAAVEFAKDLELGMLISHDPWKKDNGDRGPQECLDVNIALFQQVADLCGDAGLSLVFEPHPDTLSMNDDWCIRFIDGIDRPNVGVLYDCCHYGVGQPESYIESIARLGNRIRHLHFSDGDLQTYALHLPLGEGSLELSKIVNELKAIRFSGTLTNDMYNYPLLEDGARRNVVAIKQVESDLGLSYNAARG